MTWWLLTHKRDDFEMIVVFANTGKEREETLQFVNKCDEVFGFNTVWIEAETDPRTKYGVKAKVVNYMTANRTGAPFEEVIKKHGLPNRTTPHCSRQLKQEAIRAYARSIGWVGKRYKTAIGIRVDETRRINLDTAKKQNLIFPLVTMAPTTKLDVNEFWLKQPFDLELKSYEGNCDFCWKKSFRKLMTLATEHPEMPEWWHNMEIKYENFIPDSRKNNPNIKLPLRMYRDNATVAEIVEDSKYPFDPARDESRDINPPVLQLALWDLHLDSNQGCTESCEAF
jgi:hypothetical protein